MKGGGARRYDGQNHQAAQEELELYFAAAGGMWGLRGAPFEGGASLVWDEKRANIEHARRLADAGGTEHERLRGVTRTVEQFRALSIGHWLVALCVLTPRRWPLLLAAEMARGVRGGNLTGLLLTSERLRTVVVQHESLEPTATVSPMHRLSFAAQRASRTGAKHEFFEPLREEGETRLAGALASYDGLMRARWRAERDSKSEACGGMRTVFG